MKRCARNCHKYIQGKHKCGEADKCPGFEVCCHIDLHPEEKHRQSMEKREEKRKRGEEKKEEGKARKKQKDDLVRVTPHPEFDGWWEDELARVIASSPNLYGDGTDTAKRAKAMIVVTEQWTQARRATRYSSAALDFEVCAVNALLMITLCDVGRSQAAINKQIKQELRATRLVPEQEIAYIHRRQQELKGMGAELADKYDAEEAQAKLAEQEEDQEAEDDVIDATAIIAEMLSCRDADDDGDKEGEGELCEDNV